MRFLPLRSLFLASLFIAGCSSSESAAEPSGVERDPAPAPSGAAAEPAAPPPATSPTPPQDGGAAQAPPRPEPQSTIRTCGTALDKAKGLLTDVEWTGFRAVALGSQLVPGTPSTIGPKYATGTASRISAGATSSARAGNDLTLGEVDFALTPEPLDANEYANSLASTPIKTWYAAPTDTLLTYFAGFGAAELTWSIESPTRTPNASSNPSDRFVRGITPGLYFGYELTLSFPSTCAVGALSDALGRKALVRDATPNSGIFAPDKMAVVQDVLVKNGVTMTIRVIGNKRVTAVDSLVAASTCSPAKVADCAKLLADLAAAASSLASSAGTSDIAKLQADTDPHWSPLSLFTSPMSIVGQ